MVLHHILFFVSSNFKLIPFHPENNGFQKKWKTGFIKSELLMIFPTLIL